MIGEKVKEESKNLNLIDRILGNRLHERRVSSGLTIGQLAEELQIESEELLLYELGAKRISAKLLLRLAQILCVSPIYFFGLPDRPRTKATR